MSNERQTIRAGRPLAISGDAITSLDDVRSALLAISSLADYVELNHERTRAVWFLTMLALDSLGVAEANLPHG